MLGRTPTSKLLSVLNVRLGGGRARKGLPLDARTVRRVGTRVHRVRASARCVMLGFTHQRTVRSLTLEGASLAGRAVAATALDVSPASTLRHRHTCALTAPTVSIPPAASRTGAKSARLVGMRTLTGLLYTQTGARTVLPASTLRRKRPAAVGAALLGTTRTVAVRQTRLLEPVGWAVKPVVKPSAPCVRVVTMLARMPPLAWNASPGRCPKMARPIVRRARRGVLVDGPGLRIRELK